MTAASSTSTKSKLKRQKNYGGFENPPEEGSGAVVAPHSGPLRGPSTESQQSRNSLQVPGSLTTTPLVQKKPATGNGSQALIHQYSDSTTGGTRSENNMGSKRERFNWSGVVVSFDADSVKIENEVNGAPPGIKAIGKEVGNATTHNYL